MISLTNDRVFLRLFPCNPAATNNLRWHAILAAGVHLFTCSREGAMMALSISSIPKRIHKTLGNLRTGIVLLLLVVLASAVGTFILQRPVTDPEKLAQAYSPTTLLWLDRLSLTDIFHASWFLVLMGLVSLSIVLISVDRFPNAWRFYARPYRKTDPHFRGSLHQD